MVSGYLISRLRSTLNEEELLFLIYTAAFPLVVEPQVDRTYVVVDITPKLLIASNVKSRKWETGGRG